MNFKRSAKKSADEIKRPGRSNLFWAFSIVFILFSFSLLIFKSTWGLNDDVLMAMNVSGKGFSNKPTEYICYSNIIIGNILKKLYQIIPSYPWYGFYIFFILFISFVALLYSLLIYKYSKSRIVYFLIYFVLFGLWLIRMPQFTTAAFMIGMSGIFLFYISLYKEEKTLSSKIIFITSILFLSLSSLIRLQSFFLVIILSLPFMLIEIAKSDLKKKFIVKFLILLSVLFLITFACYMFNKDSYSKGSMYLHLLEKQKLSAELIDNNKVMEYSPRTKYIFDKVGWSLNDFILLRNWFSADDQVFSTEKKKRVLSDFKYIPTERPTIYFEFMFKDKYFYGALLLIFFFIAQMEERKKHAFEIAVSILISLVIIVYLGYCVRLPERVYMSVLSFLSFFMLFLIKNDIELKSIKGWEKFKLSFIILFVVCFFFVHYTFNTVQKYNNVMLKGYIAQLHPTRERIFLVWARSFPLEFISAFDNLDDFSEFRMFNIFSDFKDPYGIAISKEFNVRTFGELVERDNLFHICNLTDMALYSKYLKEHYNLDVAFKIYMENPFFLVSKHIKITPEIIDKLTVVPVNVDGLSYNIFLIQDQ